MKHLVENIHESINTRYWAKKNLADKGIGVNREGLYIFWRAMITTDQGTEWESGFAKDYLLMDHWTAKVIPFNFAKLKAKLIDEFKEQNEQNITRIVNGNHKQAIDTKITYKVLFGKEIEGNRSYEITFNKCFGTKKGSSNLLDFNWEEYKKYEEQGRQEMLEYSEALRRKSIAFEEKRKKKEEEDRKEAEKNAEKNAAKRKEYEKTLASRMSIEADYDNAGYMNGWSSTFPSEEMKERVHKAEKEGAYFVRSLGRCDTQYISDKYKIIWSIDSSD